MTLMTGTPCPRASLIHRGSAGFVVGSPEVKHTSSSSREFARIHFTVSSVVAELVA
jgi:hypothetical protein